MSTNPVREFDYKDSDFEKIRKIIYSKAGINLSDSKRQLVYSRLARRLRVLGIETFSEYLSYVGNQEVELEEFVNALTTNLTSFFREAHHFDFLKKEILNRKRKGSIKIWCAAASTGEEPYSIAMAVVEAFGAWSPPVEIVASDIDSNVLKVAREGVYDIQRIDSLSPERKRQFFSRGVGQNQGKVKVVQPLKDLIEFRRVNLLDKFWPVDRDIDFIFCRNVMIYFDKNTQFLILEKMMEHLVLDGFYFAGHSESFSQFGGLVKLIGKTVYVKSNGGSSGRAS